MWKLLKTEARKRDELFEEINASEMGMLGDAGSTRRLVGLWRSNPGLSIGRIQVKASGRQALNKSQDPQIHRKLGKKTHDVRGRSQTLLWSCLKQLTVDIPASCYAPRKSSQKHALRPPDLQPIRVLWCFFPYEISPYIPIEYLQLNVSILLCFTSLVFMLKSHSIPYVEIFRIPSGNLT